MIQNFIRDKQIQQINILKYFPTSGFKSYHITFDDEPHVLSSLAKKITNLKYPSTNYTFANFFSKFLK